MNTDYWCTLFWIFQDLPHQIWEAQSSDGHNIGVLVTRLLHNKVIMFSNNLARCYVYYFSPDFLVKTFTIVGLILFFAALYKIVSRRRWRLLGILLAAPIFPILRIPSREFYQAMILYIVEGIVILSALI